MTRLIKFLPLILILFSSQPVFAHAKMADSIPADGAVVAGSVDTIELDFSMPARLTLIEIEQSENGMTAIIAKGLPQSFAKHASVQTEPLTAGKYFIHWTAVAKDGHVMRGEFSFKVQD